MRLRIVALALLAGLVGAPALAQTATPEPNEDTTQVADVVVQGRRVEEAVSAFVNEVADPPRGTRLARWDRTVCVGAMNLSPDYAQYMVDRVSQIAVGIGLDVGEPGCRPEVMIIASDNGAALAQRLVRDNPTGFRPASALTDRGSAALRAFQSSDEPIRWWHVSMPVSVDTGEAAVALHGEAPPTVAVRDASRLRSNVRDDLKRVVIIVDVSKVGSVSFRALSDYVAMVALAQINSGTDLERYPTVLNLFSDREAVTGLTDWDLDYLSGLYTSRADRARPSQQQRDIARGMLGEREIRVRSDEAN
jgi:hypothetical protein